MVASSGVHTGLCSIFVQHTLASLVIQENADRAVLRDLARWMATLAPEGSGYEHHDEGPDERPATCAASSPAPGRPSPSSAGAWASAPGRPLTSWEHRNAPPTGGAW